MEREIRQGLKRKEEEEWEGKIKTGRQESQEKKKGIQNDK